MGARCTGRCCRDFDLPMSPGAARIMALAAEKGRGLDTPNGYRSPVRMADHYAGGRAYPGACVRLGSRAEAVLIGSMVRFIGRNGRGVHHYACTHLDGEGNCSIYEQRPEMCRDYPYGETCRFRECAWDEVAARLAPAATVRPPGWLRLLVKLQDLRTLRAIRRRV